MNEEELKDGFDDNMKNTKQITNRSEGLCKTLDSARNDTLS